MINNLVLSVLLGSASLTLCLASPVTQQAPSQPPQEMKSVLQQAIPLPKEMPIQYLLGPVSWMSREQVDYVVEQAANIAFNADKLIEAVKVDGGEHTFVIELEDGNFLKEKKEFYNSFRLLMYTLQGYYLSEGYRAVMSVDKPKVYLTITWD